MGLYTKDFDLKQEGRPVEAGFAENPEMASLGMVNEPDAMPPQEGGNESVADDIPQNANDGDYVLPYETVLLYGINQLNRYAKEAIKLAQKNNVDLSAANIDPEDDVPIKISNYEYVIPKGLVPFFGGGQKYLDKIREEGIAFRQELKGRGEGDAAAQQEATAPVGPEMNETFLGASPPMMDAPPEMMPMDETAMAPPMPPPPPPQAAPMEAMPAPMMQKGGFVLSKDKDAEILEQDKPETAESKRVQAQQPAMVTPDGKKTQQGFSAPMGYSSGKEVKQVDKDLIKRNRTVLSPDEEEDFQAFYRKYFPHLNPDPDHPLHKYDTRGFYKYAMSKKPEERKRLLAPQEDGYTHGISIFKDDDHPNRFIRIRGGLYDTKYNKVLTKDIDEEIEPMTAETLEEDRSQPAMRSGGFIK